ncbi:MAG: hypothetical protein HN509_07060 [Halobacteriovoraceae bacterium]|jgi:ABC-2 type transport system permease protein|nr:hypothetical protein [Halobacteriovoraceae bacterium]MBT5095775.1 hypothetical protein [Halobacteriovoraceae bacterium]
MKQSPLRHYWQVYKKMASTSASVEMSFRISFCLLVLMDLFFFLSILASVSFIYDHVQTIGPWNRDQLLFFSAFMLTIDNIHMGLVSTNFWMLSFAIRTGELDFTLIKPTHSLFTVFFRQIRPSSFVTLPVAWGILIHYGIKVQLSALDWCLIPLFLILGLTLLCLIEFIVSTSMFWLTEGTGINFLRMQMQQLSRWPNFVYSSLSRKVLTTALPVLLIGSAPVHFIYDKNYWPLIVAMLVAIAACYSVLLFVWNIGLKNYDSASS